MKVMTILLSNKIYKRSNQDELDTGSDVGLMAMESRKEKSREEKKSQVVRLKKAQIRVVEEKEASGRGRHSSG